MADADESNCASQTTDDDDDDEAGADADDDDGMSSGGSVEMEQCHSAPDVVTRRAVARPPDQPRSLQTRPGNPDCTPSLQWRSHTSGVCVRGVRTPSQENT